MSPSTSENDSSSLALRPAPVVPLLASMMIDAGSMSPARSRGSTASAETVG